MLTSLRRHSMPWTLDEIDVELPDGSTVCCAIDVEIEFYLESAERQGYKPEARILNVTINEATDVHGKPIPYSSARDAIDFAEIEPLLQEEMRKYAEA